jgi:hypothetical protein
MRARASLRHLAKTEGEATVKKHSDLWFAIMIFFCVFGMCFGIAITIWQTIQEHRITARRDASVISVATAVCRARTQELASQWHNLASVECDCAPKLSHACLCNCIFAQQETAEVFKRQIVVCKRDGVWMPGNNGCDETR